MKKTVLIAAMCLGAMAANAQVAYEQPSFGDNWVIGLDGGVTTPLQDAAFWGDMRGTFGAHIQKQISPAFALGAEGSFGVNTSSWYGNVHSATAIDNSYVGAYGAVDLCNLFAGYNCGTRPFSVEVVAGAGWGHDYQTSNVGQDWNYFVTKAGLNFNFRCSEGFSISLKPFVAWNMNSGGVAQAASAYNVNGATFNLSAGLNFHLGGGFDCVTPYNQAEIDALNGQINDLRAQLDACNANVANLNAANAGLAAELEACKNRKPEVVKEVSNQLNSVRYVFYRVGSSVITADQMPNVEMIAAYLKNHPDAKVVVRGYASPEGPIELNEKLAAARAESVKTALIKKYKINADRINAQGEGIGHMFEEETWNRVSICTLEVAK